MRSTTCGILALALWSAMTAHGAEPLLPAHIEACASLRKDSERLACYDKAVATILAGKTSTPPPSAENMFGANGEVAGAAPGHQEIKREELKQISGKVTSLRHADDGMIVLELDNGQVWRQQDSGIVLMVNTGDQVTVVRASLGTFRITDKTGRFARFKRLR